MDYGNSTAGFNLVCVLATFVVHVIGPNSVSHC